MKAKDSLSVKLALRFSVKAFGITGCLGNFVAELLAPIIGAGIDAGFTWFDVTDYGMEAHMKHPEFRAELLDLYKKAKSKLHSPEEKSALRKRVRDALDKFTSIGLHNP